MNVTPGAGTDVADLHILDLPSGARIAIDLAEAGDAPGFGLRRLQQLGVDRLDLLVISHFHWDHYNLSKRFWRRVSKLNASFAVCPKRKSRMPRSLGAATSKTSKNTCVNSSIEAFRGVCPARTRYCGRKVTTKKAVFDFAPSVATTG